MSYKEMQQRTPCAEMMPATQQVKLIKIYPCFDNNTEPEERKG